jgi:transposase
MHIIENHNTRAGKVYCYAGECLWDKQFKKYVNPRVLVGHMEGEPPVFVPNRKYSLLLADASQTVTDERDRKIIDIIKVKYGNRVHLAEMKPVRTQVQTAIAIFSGPSVVFGGITSRYRIDTILRKAFGEDDAKEILSLAWYLASEGDALINSDAWLSYFENPSGHAISSQDITRLLDRMGQDGILSFYKHWLKRFEKTGDKMLYDLTSISWHGHGIDMASWGHNRDNDALPQVNYALLCTRNTAMPLFAWPLNGSISDVRTLQDTLDFLYKLDYKPDCLMMDRGFGSMENISFMLGRGYTFLRALRINADWIRKIIDAGRQTRLRPDSIVKAGERTYYASTTRCQWVTLKKKSKKETAPAQETLVYQCKDVNGVKSEQYIAQDGEEVLSQSPCMVHILFCQDLVGNQWNNFMERLNEEYRRLLADENLEPASDLKKYFIVERKKWARNRSVDFNMECVANHRYDYAGHICFITNDKTIAVAADALREYSTRDYIEKDFDEMKNDLDMRRIRVHTDDRMRARLLIQFIAEIYIREIRVRLHDSDECRKMTRKQIASHIKGIYKIKFVGKYKDICPELSKSQRAILEALDIRDSRCYTYNNSGDLRY